MKKKIIKASVLTIVITILFVIPTCVYANIVCNDGEVSDSCEDCHQGCCSGHLGCTNDVTEENTEKQQTYSNYKSNKKRKTTNNLENYRLIEEHKYEIGIPLYLITVLIVVFCYKEITIKNKIISTIISILQVLSSITFVWLVLPLLLLQLGYIEFGIMCILLFGLLFQINK